MTDKVLEITQSGPYAGITIEETLAEQTRAKEQAVEQGYIIVEGTPNTLLLDLDAHDTSTQRVLNSDVLATLCELVQEKPRTERWVSKSGNIHTLLRFEVATFTPAEAVAIEVSLGSDQKRGVLYALRIRNGVADPRLLFRPASAEVEYS